MCVGGQARCCAWHRFDAKLASKTRPACSDVTSNCAQTEECCDAHVAAVSLSRCRQKSCAQLSCVHLAHQSNFFVESRKHQNMLLLLLLPAIATGASLADSTRTMSVGMERARASDKSCRRAAITPTATATARQRRRPHSYRRRASPSHFLLQGGARTQTLESVAHNNVCCTCVLFDRRMYAAVCVCVIYETRRDIVACARVSLSLSLCVLWRVVKPLWARLAFWRRRVE